MSGGWRSILPGGEGDHPAWQGRPCGPKAGETPPGTAQRLGIDGRGRDAPLSSFASAIVTRKLFDRGDGHGADWAAAAEASFRCAFAFLRHVPPDDPRGATIARRALDAATGLVVGSEDSGTPYTAASARPPRPAFTMSDPAPGHDLHNG